MTIWPIKDITVVYRTNQYAEIHRAKDLLDKNNIVCFVRNIEENDFYGLSQLGSGINPASGEFELCIAVSDVDKSVKLLKEIFPDLDGESGQTTDE